MAQNAAFTRPPFGDAGGSSSWADDDDLDTEPIPLADVLPKVEEKEPEHHEPVARDEPRRQERQSHDSRDRDQPHRGGYDARGPRSDRDRAPRGGYDDRAPRGGYDDRAPRGAYGDRAPRGGYADRAPRGGYESRAPRGDHDVERPKNPVPDQGPFKLYVGNLPFNAEEEDLLQFFGASDTIADIRFPRDFENDRPKGFAYVEFRTREALVNALTLDGESIAGRSVRLDVATEKKRESRQKDNGFFERRGQYEQRGADPRDDKPKERPRLSLLPRSTSTDSQPKRDGSAPRANPFGDAKPRDENAVMERMKAREREHAEAKAKAKAAKAAKATKKAAERTASNAEVWERKATPQERSEKKAASHGAGRGGKERPAAPGRGAGNADRAPAARGRGAGHTDRAPAAKKQEPKDKRGDTVPPFKVVKPAAPAATKSRNVFDALDADSDSD